MLHGNMSSSTVNGVFRGTDLACDRLLISKLATPMGVIEEAELRGSDVLILSTELASMPS